MRGAFASRTWTILRSIKIIARSSIKLVLHRIRNRQARAAPPVDPHLDNECEQLQKPITDQKNIVDNSYGSSFPMSRIALNDALASGLRMGEGWQGC